MIAVFSAEGRWHLGCCSFKWKNIGYITNVNVILGSLRKPFTVFELEAKKDCYEKFYFCQLNIKDARTLEGTRKRVPNRVSVANQQLKYYSLKYNCKFSSKVRNAERVRQRETKPFKQECPFEIYIRLSNDNNVLEVVQINEHHNHILTKELFERMPKQRALSPNALTQVRDAIDLKANSTFIQDLTISRKKRDAKIYIQHTAVTEKLLSKKDIASVVEFLKQKEGSAIDV